MRAIRRVNWAALINPFATFATTLVTLGDVAQAETYAKRWAPGAGGTGQPPAGLAYVLPHLWRVMGADADATRAIIFEAAANTARRSKPTGAPRLFGALGREDLPASNTSRRRSRSCSWQTANSYRLRGCAAKQGC